GLRPRRLSDRRSPALPPPIDRMLTVNEIGGSGGKTVCYRCPAPIHRMVTVAIHHPATARRPRRAGAGQRPAAPHQPSCKMVAANATMVLDCPRASLCGPLHAFQQAHTRLLTDLGYTLSRTSLATLSHPRLTFAMSVVTPPRALPRDASVVIKRF